MILTEKKNILIVDDEPINITVLMGFLKDDYRLVAATDGQQALDRASATPKPDLILLDIMMPGLSGYDVCRQLKGNPETHDIPVIFVSAMGETDDETNGFELGAVDYITKPISPPVVQARIKTQLTLKEAREGLANQNVCLEEMVAKRTQELAATQDITILCMTSLAETRDNETGNHIRRTQHYVRALAEYLKTDPKFKADLDPRTIELLFKSAPLHDIGKVGIPDNILLKPGKLTAEEFTIMKKHPGYGREAMVKAERSLAAEGTSIGDDSFLKFAADIAYYHHEKWDGSGYPEGLKGTAIPLSARLMAVADVYDALTCKRVYKLPFTHEKTLEIMLDGKGLHFDPDILEAFMAISDQFQEISKTFSDD